MSLLTEVSNRYMLRARDVIDRDYAQPFDIPTLAGIAHVSESHFVRVSRGTFGETPHRYLERRRVVRAMFLLRETDRTVTEICFEVGFGSLGTFSRTFTLIVGDPRPPTAGVPPTGVRSLAASPGPDQAKEPESPAGGEQFWRRDPRAVNSLASWPSYSPTQVYVLDQDEALDFYVGKLGFEVKADFDLGFMRWLTVSFPSSPSCSSSWRSRACRQWTTARPSWCVSS